MVSKSFYLLNLKLLNQEWEALNIEREVLILKRAALNPSLQRGTTKHYSEVIESLN